MEFSQLGSSFNNSMEDNYNTELKMQQEEEEINEISNKIEQSYAQLLKLTELNKAKEDMIRNLEKKLEKIMFSWCFCIFAHKYPKILFLAIRL